MQRETWTNFTKSWYTPSLWPEPETKRVVSGIFLCIILIEHEVRSAEVTLLRRQNVI